MPVAPNPLLQANAITSTSRSATAQADKPLQALGDKGDGFGQVMARQGRDKAVGQEDKAAPAKPKDKPEAAAGGKKDPADKTAVADDGNKLPADDAAQADTGLRDASLVAGQVTDAQPGAQLIQAQAEAVAPVLQAATAQVQTSVTAALPEEPAAEEAFDPDADPLANLPTLRLALEHSAQAKGGTSAHALDPSRAQGEDGQAAVNTLANLVENAEGEAGEPGDKAFGALLEDGLKDT